MINYGSSAVLVVDAGRPVGIWTERDVLDVDFSASDVCMPISKVMRSPVVTISSTLTVDAAIIFFNKVQKNGLLVVSEKGEWLGLLTQEDVISNRSGLFFKSSELIGEILWPSPILTETTSFSEAAKRMHYLEVETAIVINSSRSKPDLAGVLCRKDFLQAIAKKNTGSEIGDVVVSMKMALKNDVPVTVARSLMSKQGLRFLVVSDLNNRYIGIIRLLDVLENEEKIEYKQIKLNWSLKSHFVKNIPKPPFSEILNLAFYDPLTALPNRRAIEERLACKLATTSKRKKYGALLYIDLDHFKPINDSFGHAIGDLFLIEVADRLRQVLREEDIAARYGGDEFLVLLPELAEEMSLAIHAAQTVAEKIEGILKAPYHVESHRLTLGASIGITMFPDQQLRYEEVLKEADSAMYNAKMSNRKIHFYDRKRKTLALGQSPADDLFYTGTGRVQRVLFYTPVMDVDGNPESMHAALHWENIEKSTEALSHYSCAEEEPLMLSIGRWKLKEACLQIKSWQMKQLSVQRLSLHIGLQFFLQSNIVQQVGQIVSECCLDARLIEFDLTEEMIFNRFDESLKKMKLLSAFGIRFSIDNFACGRSSISALSKLPVHYIKINEQHVRGLDKNAENTEIVQTVIAIAKHLKFQVMAKGVETKAQFEVLKDMGCLAFQGPLFGQPMFASKVPEFLGRSGRSLQN